MSPRKSKAKKEAELKEAEQEFLATSRKDLDEPEPAAPQAAEPAATGQQPTRQKSWAETVRPWTSHGRDTGVKHVTGKVPMGEHGIMEGVGIQFATGKERTEEEKREMVAIGLKFYEQAQAWLKPNRNGAFEETGDMARRFADRRRQTEAEYVGRD